MSGRWVAVLPLMVFGAVGSGMTAAGIHTWIGASPLGMGDGGWIVAGAVSVAAHLSWIGSVGRQRSWLLALGAWLVCVYLARSGSAILLKGAEWPGVGVEAMALLQAFAMLPKEGLAEKLARWRRSREEMMVQLDMGSGVLPWMTASMRRFVAGPARPGASDTLRVMAEMQDAEHAARTVQGGRKAEPGRHDPAKLARTA